MQWSRQVARPDTERAELLAMKFGDARCSPAALNVKQLFSTCLLQSMSKDPGDPLKSTLH